MLSYNLSLNLSIEEAANFMIAKMPLWQSEENQLMLLLLRSVQNKLTTNWENSIYNLCQKWHLLLLLLLP